MLESSHQQDAWQLPNAIQVHSYDDVLNPYSLQSSQIPVIQYQMQEQIRMLTTQVSQMHMQIIHLEQIVKEQEIALWNESARAYNSSCLVGVHPLKPLKNISGTAPDQANPPVYFPSTRSDLFALSSAQSDKLLKFYDLPSIQGRSLTPVHQKYKIIASFIGVRE